jgi:addiction module HigA family antidote
VSDIEPLFNTRVVRGACPTCGADECGHPRPLITRTEPSFDPDWSVHPGELLTEAIAERGWSQADLARQTGLTPKHVCRVLSGRAALGPEAAVTIERATGISARLLMRMQADYSLFEYRARIVRIPDAE